MSKLERVGAVVTIVSTVAGIYDAWWQRRQRKRDEVKQRDLDELRERVAKLEVVKDRK